MKNASSRPPRAELLAHPRFPEALARALRKFGMEDWFDEPVRKLVSGETDPRSVICCNSGCHPCAKDYLGAAEHVVRELTKKKKRFWFF